MKFFCDKKLNQSKCVFQLMFGWKNDSPAPLRDFNRLFVGQLEHYSKYGIEIWFSFLNGINLAPKI